MLSTLVYGFILAVKKVSGPYYRNIKFLAIFEHINFWPFFDTWSSHHPTPRGRPRPVLYFEFFSKNQWCFVVILSRRLLWGVSELLRQKYWVLKTWALSLYPSLNVVRMCRFLMPCSETACRRSESVGGLQLVVLQQINGSNVFYMPTETQKRYICEHQRIEFFSNFIFWKHLITHFWWASKRTHWNFDCLTKRHFSASNFVFFERKNSHIYHFKILAIYACFIPRISRKLIKFKIDCTRATRPQASKFQIFLKMRFQIINRRFSKKYFEN
jgi:hypothetical protein